MSGGREGLCNQAASTHRHMLQWAPVARRLGPPIFPNWQSRGFHVLRELGVLVVISSGISFLLAETPELTFRCTPWLSAGEGGSREGRTCRSEVHHTEKVVCTPVWWVPDPGAPSPTLSSPSQALHPPAPCLSLQQAMILQRPSTLIIPVPGAVTSLPMASGPMTCLAKVPGSFLCVRVAQSN